MQQPNILPAPDAPEGAVLTLDSYRASDFSRGSAVLCRCVAPLVAHAYALLQRDVPCRILGRDIGEQLRNIVEKMRATDLSNFLTRLDQWREREIAKCEREDKSPERIEDQFNCLRYFVNSLDEDAQSIDDLLAKIDLMFTDDTEGGAQRVTLSSIHKAKGMEYPLVFILDIQLIPSKYAKREWQRQQEKNLWYVAATRARDTLVYIESERWKE